MDEDSRPGISPYTDHSVPLYFGGSCTLYISPHLLAQSHKLQTLYLDNPLHVLDVSHDAGHVLIHYLITSTYQSLKPGYLSPHDNTTAEFATSVRVYTAAKTYVLPNLAELAKTEIERLGEKLQFPMVFNLLRDAYPVPETDDVWISSYLKNRLKDFLKDGVLRPLTDDVAVPYKTMSISDIFFETMLELFRENKVSLRENIHGAFERVRGDLGCMDSPKEEGNEQAVREAQAQADREAAQTANEAEELVAQEIAKAMAAAAAAAKEEAEEEAEIAQLIDRRDNSFMGLTNLKEQRLHLLQAKSKKRAEERAAREAEDAVREAERPIEDAKEQEARKPQKAAAVAKEEEEIAFLKRKAKTVKGKFPNSQKEKPIEFQANATRRDEEKVARETGEKAAHGVEQAAKKAGQAAEEERGKGKKGKKNNKNDVIMVDSLRGRSEDSLIVKTQQEATNDNEKENKDDSRALNDGQKSSKGEKKNNSEANAPIVHTSDGDPAVDLWQDAKSDDVKESLKEDEGWGF